MPLHFRGAVAPVLNWLRSLPLPEVYDAQVVTLLRQGRLPAAAHLARTHDLPLGQARVHLAHGDPAAALVVLGERRLKG